MMGHSGTQQCRVEMKKRKQKEKTGHTAPASSSCYRAHTLPSLPLTAINQSRHLAVAGNCPINATQDACVFEGRLF